MNIRNPKRATPAGIVPPPWAGQDAYLDRDIGYGLFQACNGSKYLITADLGVKIAIALSHRFLPAFTFVPLSHQALDYGEWWGSCRLSLTHPAPRGSRTAPGRIGIIEHYASMDCCSETGRAQAIALGAIGSDAHHWREFDGWAFEPAEVSHPFFERLPSDMRSSNSPRQGDAGFSAEFVLRQ